MERRTFTLGLGALIAAPALPVSAAATPATAAISKHFAKAKLLARCHDRASPEMLGRLMQLDRQTAQDLFHLLKERNVITQGLDGIMRSVNPLNTNCVPNEAIRARNLARFSATLKGKTKRFAQTVLENGSKCADQDTENKDVSTQDRQFLASTTD